MSYHDEAENTENTPSNPWEDEEEQGPEPSITSEGGLHVESPELEGGQEPTASFGTDIIPVWLREQSKTFRFAWVPLPLRRTVRFVNEWTRGPEQAQIQHIQPWFPAIQELPLRFVKAFFPYFWQKAIALCILLATWLLTFCLVINIQQSSGKIQGYGHPVPIWCGANFWNSGNGCGMDGNNCRPFDNSSLPFKCNANCLSVRQLEPYTIGAQEVQYVPLVIGGSDKDTGVSHYRADSFICQAAIHAGIVSDETGGCGVVEMVGRYDAFSASSGNQVTSLAFDASFPKSYTFRKDISSDCGAVDMRWKLLGVTVTYTILVSLLVSSPRVFFGSVFTLLFFHVGMVSDPPVTGDTASLFSKVIGRFLPAAFVGVVIYMTAVRFQLKGLTAQLEKTILWLGGAWIGSLSNYTFDWIPVQRLTPHDLAQPGAVISVTLIVILIFAAALGQIYYLRLEKLLRKYLAVYALIGLFLLIGVAIPQLNLRIHHYILALVLLPGTRIQTRPSLLYQGLLLGLFINGIARWGFDSVLQTSYELFHGGDVKSLLPNVTSPIVHPQNITFNWRSPPENYDGISVLINDVERKRWYVGEGSPSFTWDRAWEEESSLGEKMYFRFAYMQGSEAQDYTKAGIWERNGSWTEWEQDPSDVGV